ncbi:Hypothetical predicted protein [Olea europaea subsp. europaea]|uniref:Uncharacterized protein n=1 Tax=Olea europaea subsp. europaea TaxID=158383 RepID=A0A8S0R7X3_OLEEU|nr:Hypothetical predicted protein [Olea europaea subsp. europaea]
MKNLNEEQKCERQTRMEKGTEGDKIGRVDAIVAEPSGTEKLTDGIERISHESQTEQQVPLQIVEQSELVLANQNVVVMVEEAVTQQMQSENHCQDNNGLVEEGEIEPMTDCVQVRSLEEDGVVLG